MPQLIIFRSWYWESREQILKCAIAAVWLAILISSCTWNNNFYPERNIWQWLNALVLAYRKQFWWFFSFFGVFFFFSRFALGFIPASKSNQAFALCSLGARTETSNKLGWRLCILSSGSGREEHGTNKEQSHWIQCSVFMQLMGLELVTWYSKEITKTI